MKLPPAFLKLGGVFYSDISMNKCAGSCVYNPVKINFSRAVTQKNIRTA